MSVGIVWISWCQQMRRKHVVASVSEMDEERPLASVAQRLCSKCQQLCHPRQVVGLHTRGQLVGGVRNAKPRALLSLCVVRAFAFTVAN